MVERRSLGRRFVDIRLDAPIPVYPVELERRQLVRRHGDRPPVSHRRARRRMTLLFCASWKCAWCGYETRVHRNVAMGARKHVVVDPPLDSPCGCPESKSLGTMMELGWRFQGGNES